MAYGTCVIELHIPVDKQSSHTWTKVQRLWISEQRTRNTLVSSCGNGICGSLIAGIESQRYKEYSVSK